MAVFPGLGEDYQAPPITDRDREISLILWGFTLGFGFLTCWKAFKQTMKVNPSCRHRSIYVWLIWLDILGSFGFGIGAWFFMQGHVKPGFPLFFIIVFSWAIQIQSQLQIILNRLSVIWGNRRRAIQLRWGVFGLILCVNFMVGSIWIPMAMGIDPIYGKINNIWDRIQKVIYLLVDASLNFLFVRIVKKELVELGLTKYKKLADFNIRIILISIAMDVMIIGTMSYPNAYVFMSFHPPAFLIKVNIEMSMAELILKIARSKEHKTAEQAFELSQWTLHGRGDDSGYSPSTGAQHSNPQRSFTQRSRHARVDSFDDEEAQNLPTPKIAVVRTAEVKVDVESLRRESRFNGGQRGFQDHNGPMDFDTIDRDGDVDRIAYGHGRRASQRIGHRVEVSTNSNASQTELKPAAAPFDS